jgi:hypothetical protein
MGYEPISLYLAYFSVLRFSVWCTGIFDVSGNSLILLDVMKVD